MKRVPQLRDLSDDHHTGLVLALRCKRAARVESGASPAQIWSQVRDAFATHLEPHFQIEDQHLLPALDAIGETSLATRIRDDHRDLRAMRDAGTTDLETLVRFGTLLESHIRFEERQVFETTQHRLPASTLDAIAAACEEIPRSCASDVLG